MLVSCEALPFTKYDIRRLVISDVVKDLRLDRGQGLVVQGPGLEVRGQGQGLVNWSSRTILAYSKEWLTYVSY